MGTTAALTPNCQSGRIKSMLNYLLAVPFCNVCMGVQTTSPLSRCASQFGDLKAGHSEKYCHSLSCQEPAETIDSLMSVQDRICPKFKNVNKQYL